eukprot:5284201-Pyramimonas_sp.AAC.1
MTITLPRFRSSVGHGTALPLNGEFVRATPALCFCSLLRWSLYLPGWPGACPITLNSPSHMPTISVLAYGVCLMG